MLKKHLVLPVSLIVSAFGVTTPLQAQFWTNQVADPVVLQVGPGGSTTIVSGTGYSTVARHYLAGIPAQGSAFSTATFASTGAAGSLVLSGSATSEGNLTNSVDRNFVVLAGYEAAAGTLSVNSATANANRVVGFANVAPFVGLTGTTTTAYPGAQATNYNANNIRSAVSTGGPSSDAWTGGTGTAANAGVRYQTTNQISNPPTNVRSVDIYNGQLFTSSGSSPFVGINNVGTGTPTSGIQVVTNFLATGTGSSPYEYVAYNDPNGNQTNLTASFGVNRFYIADDRTTINTSGASGGIQRWSWNGSTWVLDYTLNENVATPGTGTSPVIGARGLSGYLNDSGVAILYFTNSVGTELRELADTGAASTSFVLATADANTVFRGVALTVAVPEPTTYALLGVTGIVGMGVWFQRRRKAQTARFARI